jgi:hypothetical protein
MSPQPKAKSSVYRASQRETVNHPLTPSLLSEIDALGDTPPPTGPFEPQGNWTHTYRIWTCYGYRGQGNRDQGRLTVRRQAGPGDEGFRLRVEQSVGMDPRREQDVHHIAADIRCRHDPLASPVSWTFSSWFTRRPQREPQPELDHAEKGQPDGRRLAVWIGERRYQRDVSERFTADWCLFEAVQRLPFGVGRSSPPDIEAGGVASLHSSHAPVEFDLLEGLTVWKPGQRLSYREKLPVTWGSRRIPLHCFEQLGMGVWPYEYWLDAGHRLLMVVTGPRVYIWESGQGDV